VLRYLALLLAFRIQDQTINLPTGWDDMSLSVPPGWDSDSPYLPVPILCPLGAIAGLLMRKNNADRALWQAIERALDDAQGSRAGLCNHLQDAIRRGGVLLLFDGLDELPTGGINPRQQVAQAVRRFAIQTAPNTPIVITSRQVEQFVRQWYAELAGTLEEPANRRAEHLIEALRSTTNERIQKLIGSPLLLTMLAILHYNRNELPEDRVEVYEQCVDLLLDRWEPRRTPGVQHPGLLARLDIPNLKKEQLREDLHKLALQSHAQPPGADGRGFLDRGKVSWSLVEFFRRLRVDDPLSRVDLFIDGLVKDAGLLQVPADDRYAFPHLTFQEYLAACGLASRDDMVNAAYAYWTGPDGGRWREVLLLFVGRLRQQGTLAVERDAVAWLERLTAERVGREPKTARQRAQDAALAALSYQELGGQTALAGTQIDIEARVEQPLRTAVAALLSTPDSGVVLDDRIKYARLLADLGDPRYPVTPDEWATSLRGLTTDTHHLSLITTHYSEYWCYVRPGTYRIGGWEADEAHADITLPGFWIARYPMTVAQYREFVEAGGYDEQDYWTGNGWTWKQRKNRVQPWGWDRAYYNGPNQALIGVTWYEAMVFCEWLTVQLADVLPADYVLRLPIEAEWEAAAAYDQQMQRHIYPWGEAMPTLEHAIFSDNEGKNVGAPMPVGICPSGAAACGALDMSQYLSNKTTYTVTPLEGAIASGRVEETFLFSQKICTMCKFFVKKDKNVPCCRRRVGRASGQTSGLIAYHVSPVI
jgi:hypothetical protein